MDTPRNKKADMDQPIPKCREGWEEKFALMAQNGDDALIDDVQESLWDASGEWEWGRNE